MTGVIHHFSYPGGERLALFTLRWLVGHRSLLVLSKRIQQSAAGKEPSVNEALNLRAELILRNLPGPYVVWFISVYMKAISYSQAHVRTQIHVCTDRNM